MKQVSGIYKITNKIDGRSYIGRAINIGRRWNAHRGDLNKNIHRNRHLQNAWNKYGSQNFTFEILLDLSDIPKEELSQTLPAAEMECLIEHRSNFYNLMIATEGTIEASEETKKLLSEHHKRVWSDPLSRSKRIAAFKSYFSDKKTRKERTEHLVEFSKLDSTREKVSKHFKELWRDETHRETQSERRKFNWQDSEYVNKQRNSRMESWKDPEKRQRRIEGLTKAAQNSDVIDKRREGNRKTWAEKKSRGETAWSEERKAALSRRFQDPEIKAKRSTAQKARWAKAKSKEKQGI